MSQIIKLYQRKLENTFDELNKFIKPGGIVFLGDSITEFFRINEFFPGKYVINRGIGSDTTEGVLKRLKNSVYDLSPSKVFVMIGTNDIAGKIPEQIIISNIGKIIAGIRENCPETKIYLESIYPVSHEKNKKIKRHYIGRRNNEIIRRINIKLEIMAAEMGIIYIDVFSRLINQEGNIKLDYTVEGLHLTIEGYNAVTEVLAPYVMNTE